MKPHSTPPAADKPATTPSRRGFLGVAAAGIAGILIAPGIRLIEIAQAAPAAQGLSPGARGTVRWGMLIDSTQCASGCTDCVTACNTENGLSGGTKATDSQWIRKIEIKEIRTGKVQSLPMMCQHCAEPPCVDVCPTGASFKRADGIVLVDKHTCIGCRYCMMACPYKARSFVHEPVTGQKTGTPRGKGCVESCDFCAHRIDAGGTPACVESCAAAGHQALVFGDLNDPQSEISQRVRASATTQLRADLRTDNGVRYRGV